MKKFTRLSMLMLFASLLALSAFAQPTILVVDRDGSSYGPDIFTDVWPLFEEALIDNEYDYEYWEVMNAEDNGPDFVYMGDFDMVIWFTGEAWEAGQTMTFDDEINLILYLADGGNLFLSAQDYLWDVYPTAGTFEEGQFPYDYLGLREVVQDLWNIDMPDLASVDGVAGSLAEGMEFEFQDLYTFTRDGLFIDDITDHVGTDMFFLYDPAPEGICGVQYETDLFKTVFTTASYACIVDYDARMELMVNIVNFLTGSAPPVCYPYFDDFESFTAGGYLAEQGECWTTWSGAPGTGEDAFVVDEQAYSGDNSVKVEGSSTDLIFPLGNKIEGQYEVSMYMYVESGYGGYYNLMHEFGDNNEWAIEIYFASDGSGYIHAGGANAATFTYPVGTWFKSVMLINLNSDYAEYWVNDVFVHGWQWSLQSGGDPGLNQLGVVDIFAAAPTGDSPMFFFDDFEYKEATGVGINNHITPADITMFPNPAYDQVEITSVETIKEVNIFNNMGQMVLSQVSDNSRVVINISNYPTGIYTVQIKTENGINTQKLLIK